ncbi:MAG TPA: heme-binding protein [Vicinamibacterales bacterium]|nr:heme-binding protein [Vicinamibacterales bacterium]
MSPSAMIVSSVFVLALCGAVGAADQLPTRRTMTLDAARKVAAAAEAEARKNNWSVAIAVVDDGGQLILFQRMDGTKLVAIDIAVRKARTAVFFQQETRLLEEEVTKGRTALLPIDGFMPLEGGVPLAVGGQVVGAVGVSGVTGAQDAQCALAGAKVLPAK